MAKKTPSKTKKPATRAKAARPVRGSSKSSASAAEQKYEQSGAPWWKAHLPPR
jgi:hypothetical protein